MIFIACFACSEHDYSSYCPTWKGFTYKTGNYPNYTQGRVGNVDLHRGDSIHITAHQDKLGHGIHATDYTWTICFDTIDNESGEKVHATKSYHQHTNYDGLPNGSDDPVGHLLIPKNALTTNGIPDTIRFVAQYAYSGQGVSVENGNLSINSSYNGRITPRSGYFQGGAQGNFVFHIIKEQP